VVGERFGARAESRPLHVDVSAAVVNARPFRPRALEKRLAQLAHTGSANAMCATTPRPKNVCSSDRFVRSTNWSGKTMSHGRCLACKDPTALTLRIQAAPSFFIP